MDLGKKKSLAAKTLNVGKGRIAFVFERIADIKEAITKQDIRDLKDDGAIVVKDISGRKKNIKRKNRRSAGKIKKTVNTRKQDYVIMTRKLRAYTQEMYLRGEISLAEKKEIRKKIRNKMFKSKAHLKQYIQELKK